MKSKYSKWIAILCALALLLFGTLGCATIDRDYDKLEGALDKGHHESSDIGTPGPLFGDGHGNHAN